MFHKINKCLCSFSSQICFALLWFLFFIYFFAVNIIVYLFVDLFGFIYLFIYLFLAELFDICINVNQQPAIINSRRLHWQAILVPFYFWYLNLNLIVIYICSFSFRSIQLFDTRSTYASPDLMHTIRSLHKRRQYIWKGWKDYFHEIINHENGASFICSINRTNFDYFKLYPSPKFKCMVSKLHLLALLYIYEIRIIDMVNII